MGISFEHGYRLKGDLSTVDFIRNLRILKKDACALALTMAAGALAKCLADEADQLVLEGKPIDFAELYSLTYQNVQERYQTCQKTLIRDPEVDLECQISFTERDQKVYALLHAEKVAYAQLLERQGWIEPYPWYDTDQPPKGITRDQWHNRREEWMALFKNRDLVYPGGALETHFTLLGRFFPAPNRDQVREAVPELKIRAHRKAKEVMMNAAWAKEHGKDPAKTPMAVFLEVSHKLETDQKAQKEFEEHQRQVLDKIKVNTPDRLVPKFATPRVVT